VIQRDVDGFFIVAIGALLFGGFCFGSFVFHLLRGRAGFAMRTLSWATGAWPGADRSSRLSLPRFPWEFSRYKGLD